MVWRIYFKKKLSYDFQEVIILLVWQVQYFMLGELTINQLINCLETTGRIAKGQYMQYNADRKFFISKVTRRPKTSFSFILGYGKSENMLLFLVQEKIRSYLGFFNPETHHINVTNQQQKLEKFQNYVFEVLLQKSQYYPLQELSEIGLYREKIYVNFGQTKYEVDCKSDMCASSWFDLITNKQKSIKIAQPETYQVMEPNQNEQKPRQVQYIPQKMLFNNQVAIKTNQEMEKLREQKEEIEIALKEMNQRFSLLQAESEENIKKQQQRLDLLLSEKEVLNNTIQQLNSSFQKKEKIFQGQIQRHQIQLQEQTRINKQNVKVLEQYEKEKQQAEELRKQLQSQSHQITELEAQIKNLKSESISYSRQIEEKRIEFMRTKGELQEENKREKQKLQTLASLRQNQQSLHIFEGNILHGVSAEKTYLKESIQSLMSRSIQYSSLIYKHDPKNSINFHQYIDQHPNLCIVIKLKNGRLIAGFSVSPLSNKTLANQSGIICSLSQKKAFKILEGKRSVTYDSFFLIFGNSELRLKQGEMKFFTNFGIANSFFDSNGEKYTVLNGEGAEREVLFDNYEIFEVFFK